MKFTDIFRWFETGKLPTTTEALFRDAEKGSAVAQVKLGLCYYKGDGVQQDYKEAIRRFRLAARQGNAQAKFYLGRAHVSGEGVSKCYERAYGYFEAAAVQGDQDAAEWRSIIIKKMTPEQILEGKRLAQEGDSKSKELIKPTGARKK